MRLRESSVHGWIVSRTNSSNPWGLGPSLSTCTIGYNHVLHFRSASPKHQVLDEQSTVVHYCQAAEEPCYMFFVRQYLPLSSLSLPALAIQMTATKERIETIRKETSTGGSTEGSTGRQFEESTFRVHPSTRSYHLLICSIPPQPHQFRSAIMPNIIQKRLLLNN